MLEHLARLAYQGGDKALQVGWWGYAKDKAQQAGISEVELLAAIEKLKKGGKE